MSTLLGFCNPMQETLPGGELRFSLLGSQVLESEGNRIATGHWFAFLPRGLVGETIVRFGHHE